MTNAQGRPRGTSYSVETKTEAMYLMRKHGLSGTPIAELLNLSSTSAAYNFRTALANRTWEEVPLDPLRMAALDVMVEEYVEGNRVGSTPTEPPPPAPDETPLADWFKNGEGADASLVRVEPNGRDVAPIPVNGDDDRQPEPIDLGSITLDVMDMLNRMVDVRELSAKLVAAREEVAHLTAEKADLGAEIARQIVDKEHENEKLELENAALRRDNTNLEQTLHIVLKGKYQ